MPLKVLFITLITFVYNISVQPADLLMHMDIDVKCDQINLFTTGIDITFLLGYSTNQIGIQCTNHPHPHAYIFWFVFLGFI